MWGESSDTYQDVLDFEPLTRLCATCGFRLEASLLRCPLDGAPLGPPSADVQRLGAYRLIRRLGRGGMGVVYQAENERLGRVVAIKLLARQMQADHVVLERFFLEARAVNSICHPNVVQTYDLVSDGQDVYMVMEYLAGEDLATQLARGTGQPWAVARVVHVLEQICGALEATHRQGIIHRDLKPANIFLTTREGQADFVKVLDFGIVKLAGAGGRLTLEGLTMGTPAYMSPEQIYGEPLDGRSDLYGLGCIAFELLTGRPLFGAGAHADVMMAQLNEPPQSPRALNPAVPPALDALILRCLAKEADGRPASAFALAQALATAVGRPFDGSGSFEALMPVAPTHDLPPRAVSGLRPVVKSLEATQALRALRPRGLARWLALSVLGGALVAAALWATRPGAAPAQAEPARVLFQSQPPGAIVWRVDTHERWGPTPLERVLPQKDVFSVRFELPGHEPLERRVEALGVSTVAVSLAPLPAPPAPPPEVAPTPVGVAPAGSAAAEAAPAEAQATPPGPGRRRPAPTSRRAVPPSGVGTLDPFAR